MPIKEREPFTLHIIYNGEIYFFNTYRIFKKCKHICNCDLTATDYYGNELVTRLCCQVALDAYYAGKQDGKEEYKKEAGATLKDLLGL